MLFRASCTPRHVGRSPPGGELCDQARKGRRVGGSGPLLRGRRCLLSPSSLHALLPVQNHLPSSNLQKSQPGLKSEPGARVPGGEQDSPPFSQGIHPAPPLFSSPIPIPTSAHFSSGGTGNTCPHWRVPRSCPGASCIVGREGCTIAEVAKSAPAAAPSTNHPEKQAQRGKERHLDTDD